MTVLSYKNDYSRSFANIEFDNGDRVHVRVSFNGIRILMLRFGQIPFGVVWAVNGSKEIGRLFYGTMASNLLDIIIEQLRTCNSAADIKTKLSLLGSA